MTWSVVWSTVIPTTMLHLGAYSLVMAVVLVFLDVPGKGVPWDKVAAAFGVIGGFGVGGAAAGWFGRGLASASGAMIGWGQRLLSNAVGVGVMGVFIAAFAVWAYSRIRGKGIGAKTKFKSTMLVVFLSLAGTVLAALPEVYGWGDNLVNAAGSALISAIVA
jgi:hypothetical protein